MSSFESNRQYLRELLIYFFNLKKTAAEAHQLLVERYDEAALSERCIIESRFVPNATRTIRWKIIRMKRKVPFFHNKCPIFDKKNGGNLFVHLICLFIEIFFYIHKYLGPDKPSLLSSIQFPQVSNRYLITFGNATGEKNYPYPYYFTFCPRLFE